MKIITEKEFLSLDDKQKAKICLLVLLKVIEVRKEETLCY